MDEIFPWDFIDIGVTRKFLEREWQQAMAGQVTPNCREKCSGCGAARFGCGVCFEKRDERGRSEFCYEKQQENKEDFA